MPMMPSPRSAFQCRRTIGMSLRSSGSANGARMTIAKNQRKNVIANGDTSGDSPRPTIQLHDQKNGASVSSA